MAPDKPTHRLALLSDWHFTEANAPFQGVVDTEANLLGAFDRLSASGQHFDAIICSGDLTDTGSVEAYRRIRAIIDAQSARFGVPVLAGAGNHDVLTGFNSELLDRPADSSPADSVSEVNGLRIVHLDSSVPGAGHGEVTAAQLDWLRRVLAEPAEHGTVLVVHHPPIPTSAAVMALVALRNRGELADALAGSDVRVILSGHMHSSGSASLAGIPVVICGALSYAVAPLFDHLGHRGLNANQSFTLVEFFDDQVVSTVVPLVEHPTLLQVNAADLG